MTSLASLALALVSGVGPARWRRLLAEHGSAVAALKGGVARSEASIAWTRAAQLLRACHEDGVRVLTLDDTAYPSRLCVLQDPPNPLFLLGGPEPWRQPSVAIVGSRKATTAGRRAARGIATQLAREGVCIVSGLAAGIDAEAHTGALAAGGTTIAVMGTGVDVAYPVANAHLHARIVQSGLVVSESMPGARAHGGAFPRRNRIIAALADLVLVVEAGARSGALITAQVGDAINRPVAAVPGPIDVPECVGSNTLLRDGAHVVLGADDVLTILSLPRASSSDADERRRAEAAQAFHADTPEFRILEVLAGGPQFADDLVRVAGSGARDVGAALSMLTVTGLVDVDASGLVRKR